MRTIIVLALLGLMGCTSTTPPVPPTPMPTPVINPAIQSVVDAGVGALTSWGCKKIPAADQAASKAALQKIQAALGDLPTALALAGTLAKVPGIAYVWSALHVVLDALNWLSAQSWTAYAEGALGTGVNSCLAVLP